MLVLAARAALAANQLNRVVDDIGPAIFRLPGHDTRVQRIALSLTAVGLGQVAPTATDSKRLSALATPGHPTAHAPIALLATGELVEAAVRAEVLDGIEPMVARFERWAELRASGEIARRRDPAILSQLTPQERQVARLAAQGLTNRQIAARRSRKLVLGMRTNARPAGTTIRPDRRRRQDIPPLLRSTPLCPAGMLVRQGAGQAHRCSALMVWSSCSRWARSWPAMVSVARRKLVGPRSSCMPSRSHQATGVPLMSTRLALRSAVKAASSSAAGGRASVAHASWS
jgi:hypothetical protein